MVVVLGIGNEFRCDDAVGVHYARKMQEFNFSHVKVIESSGEGSELMGFWENASNIIICDAVQANKEPGYIHVLEAHKDKLPFDFFNYSSHAFGLAEAVEMSRALNVLPAKLVIYGIEGKVFNAGTELSAEVQKSLDEVVRITKDILLKEKINA